MRYMLLIYDATDPQALDNVDPAQRQATMDAYAAFTKEVVDKGLMQAGDALLPPTTATSVQVRDGETITSDGPFAETKEWLGGFYILDCNDLDQAIEYAAKIPAAQFGTIEVRPVVEIPPEYMT